MHASQKLTSVLALVALIGFGPASCKSDPLDSVTQAKSRNNATLASDAARKKSADFLVEMADARMMDAQEGAVAAARATRPDVRAYGAKMVAEQPVLLEELRALATAQGVTLPTRISNDKSDGLKDLQSESGKALDSKFISMITIDHERDVKAFARATTFNDPPVRDYAQKRLPTIKEHLREIQRIKSAE